MRSFGARGTLWHCYVIGRSLGLGVGILGLKLQVQTVSSEFAMFQRADGHGAGGMGPGIRFAAWSRRRAGSRSSLIRRGKIRSASQSWRVQFGSMMAHIGQHSGWQNRRESIDMCVQRSAVLGCCAGHFVADTYPGTPLSRQIQISGRLYS